VVDDGESGDGDGGAEVGEDAHPAAPDPVDEPAADEGGRDGRYAGGRGDQAGDGGVAGARQDQPGQDDPDRGVAEERERLGGEEEPERGS